MLMKNRETVMRTLSNRKCWKRYVRQTCQLVRQEMTCQQCTSGPAVCAVEPTSTPRGEICLGPINQQPDVTTNSDKYCARPAPCAVEHCRTMHNLHCLPWEADCYTHVITQKWALLHDRGYEESFNRGQYDEQATRAKI